MHIDLSSAKKPLVILHIGAPKTGSTALQKFLSHNTQLLQEDHILYPESILRGYGHHDLAFLTGNGYPSWATSQPLPLSQLISKIKAEISAWKGHILISSENFYLLSDPRSVKTAISSIVDIDDYDVKVLLYVRRQDEAHISWFNQVVKAQGFTGTLDEAIGMHKELWDYAERLSSWESEFGKEAIVIKSYNDISKNNIDICEDLSDMLDLDKRKYAFPHSRVNTAINLDILEFQRNMNKLPLPAEGKRRFHKELIELTRATQGTGVFRDEIQLPDSWRKRIVDQYEVGNICIANTYLNREYLFENSFPGMEEESDSSDLTSDKLSLIFAWIMARYEIVDDAEVDDARN